MRIQSTVGCNSKVARSLEGWAPACYYRILSTCLPISTLSEEASCRDFLAESKLAKLRCFLAAFCLFTHIDGLIWLAAHCLEVIGMDWGSRDGHCDCRFGLMEKSQSMGTFLV
jgi:hypothetical protein